MSKKKIAPALMMAMALLTAASAVYAEDAASASYQMRLAANENQSVTSLSVMSPSVTSGDVVKPVDLDQPRPIKLKLHRHWKKAHGTTVATDPVVNDEVASAETSKSN